MSIITKRSEILFLYEIENANPNGDPLNENRPRFDTEDNKILVSDVRLKRTIRDYWFEYKGFNGSNEKDIFVRETHYELDGKNYVTSGKQRAELFKESKDKVLTTCIDVRVFGGVLPIKGDTFTFTGPTQFQMGKSLHEVDIVTEQGTGAFASAEKKAQATFRTEYKVPYAMIGFNGIINEKAAQYTQMTDTDKSLLIDGIWNGTKNLISRSKFGQTPLLLLVINYKEPFYIGGLRQRLKLKSEKNDLKIRSTEDYLLDISGVKAVLKENADKIENISVQIDSRLKVTDGNALISLKNGLVNGI
jgi:CRISPR-associated protein Csh2